MSLEKRIRRYFGILTGFVMLCGSLAALFIYSRRGNLRMSIFFGGLSWLGYTAVHYADTGRLLDTRKYIEKHNQEKEEPGKIQKLKASTGVPIFTAGAAVLAKGVSTTSYSTSFIGACGAIGGYAVFHYFMEGELF